jgi:predicted transcriptional regulator
MNIKKEIKRAIKRKFPAVGIEDNLEHAMRQMADANTSALVVKLGEELVGLVTVTDIMYSLANGHDLQNTKVSTFMTKCEFISNKRSQSPACLQLDEDEKIISAIKVMYEGGVNHLLVSGSNGEPVGMVSSLEMIKALVS